MDGVFNKSAGSINCDSDRRSQMFQRNGFDYGTVRVSLNFSVEKSFFKSQKEALYSEMTGKDIGTKIKGMIAIHVLGCMKVRQNYQINTWFPFVCI